MAYTFRLAFHGLCAFVPQAALDTFGADGQMLDLPTGVTVILPDLVEPPEGLGTNEPHLPFVRYDPKNLAATNPATDRETNITVSSGADELRSCLLKREELSLSSNMPLGNFRVTNRKPAALPDISPGEEELIFWLAKASGRAKAVLDGLLSPNDPLVAGRMRLASGRFHTLETSQRVFDMPGGRRQRLATKVALEHAGADDNQTFTLSFVPFGGGNPKTLIFGRTAAAGNPSLVEVEIKNREAFDLVGASPIQDPNNASEFSFIYELMDNPPADRRVPSFVPPHGFVPPAKLPTLRTLCPPVALDGF